MGWYFVGLVMWGTTLMLVVALVINNIQRQFPMYWWTDVNLKQAKKGDVEMVPDAQGGLEKRKTTQQQRYDISGEWIQISGAEVIIPEDLSLNHEETRVLERLRERLRKIRDGTDVTGEEQDTTTKADSASTRSSAESTVIGNRDHQLHGNGRGNSL